MSYSVTLAYCISVFAACLYVVAVHFGQSMSVDRNNPVVIRGRMTRVSIACVVLLIGTPAVLTYILGAYPDYSTAFVQLQLLNFGHFARDIKSLLAILVLYAGPIWNYLFTVDYDIKVWYKEALEEITLIWGIRDLVFAPVTEELIYRSVIYLIFHPLIVAGKYSKTAFMIWTPFLFGVSHLHHGYRLYTIKKLQLSMVIFNGLLQTAYTTLFGILANHFLLKNNSIYGSILVHSVCNCVGFPDIVPDMMGSIYYPMLLVGIVGFYFML